MSRAMMARLLLPAVLLMLPLGFSRPAPAGPPWISLEVPANPLDPETRGAAMLVRVFHHEHPAALPLHGTAEGLVNGERRSIDLEFRETGRGAVYAVEQVWPAEGDWVLAITAGTQGEISLLVELGANGGIRSERYYDWQVKALALRSVRTLEGRVGRDRIETLLTGE